MVLYPVFSNSTLQLNSISSGVSRVVVLQMRQRVLVQRVERRGRVRVRGERVRVRVRVRVRGRQRVRRRVAVVVRGGV